MPHIDRRGMRRPAVARLLVLVCGGLAWLGVPATARAQIDPSGSIRGVVRDERGAVLRGVTLTATAPEVALPSETATDDIGDYTLGDMRPGTYQIVARLDGFATTVRENVRVQAGLNVGLDLVMRIGKIGETITVTADTPMLEIRSPSTALNLSGEFQRALPLAPRQQWFDALHATPSSTLSETIYGVSFWVNGADSTSLVVQMDGADVGASVQSTTGFLKANSEITQDVQIKTTGAEASTPLGHGAAITVVTRSGTNQSSGSASLSGQPRSWVSANNPSGTEATYSVMQPSFALGGPVVRDRLWYFGAYRYGEIITGMDRSASQLAVLKQLRPDFKPFDNVVASHQGFGKVTWAPAPSQRMEFSLLPGTERFHAGDVRDEKPFAYSRIGGQTVTLNMSSAWRDKTTIRGSLTYNNQTSEDRLASLTQPGRVVHLSVSDFGDTLVGDGQVAVLDNVAWGNQLDSPAAKLTAVIDLTHTATLWRRPHDLQIGVYLQPMRLVEYRQRYPTGGFAVEELVARDPNNLAAGLVPFHRTFIDRESLTVSSMNSQDYAAYIQDAWRAASRLTVTAGLRLDAIKRRDRIFDTTVQRTLAIGPRFGVRYSLTDSRVLRASWSRIHDAVSVGSDLTSGTDSPGVTDQYDLNLDGVFDSTVHTPGIATRVTNRFFDLEEFRQPSIDELAAGITQQLPGQMTFDVSVVNRRYRDRPGTFDVNAIYENGQFLGYRNEDFNEIYRVASNTYNTPVFSAVNLQVAKRGPRVQFVGGVTRQWRHLAGTWQPNDPAAIIQPDAFPNDRGLGAFFRSTQNSLSGIDATVASQWRDYSIRALMSVRAPGAVNLAFSYWGQSGPWSGPVVTRIAAPDPAFGPPTLTLGNGRVVNNPLATTIRFAYAQRGDGQLRLPSVHAWNMKISRDVTWRRVSIRPALEILNIINRRAFYDYLRGANQLYNPNVGRAINPQLPRSAQASLSVIF